MTHAHPCHIAFFSLTLRPNHQYYDPRVWVREGEKTLVARVKEACTDLGNISASLFSALT